MKLGGGERQNLQERQNEERNRNKTGCALPPTSRDRVKCSENIGKVFSCYDLLAVLWMIGKPPCAFAVFWENLKFLGERR